MDPYYTAVRHVLWKEPWFRLNDRVREGSAFIGVHLRLNPTLSKLAFRDSTRSVKITILDARQYITGQMVGLPDQGDVATALKAWQDMQLRLKQKASIKTH